MIAAEVRTREISQMDRRSSPLHVLVVDDEPLIRWSLTETLTDRGYHVVESGDGRSARSAVRDASREFDVVVLDLRLPDAEDLSLLASLRRATPGSRIILMTAFGTPEVLRSALDLGAYRVISKPFELHDLADLVEEAGASR